MTLNDIFIKIDDSTNKYLLKRKFLGISRDFIYNAGRIFDITRNDYVGESGLQELKNNKDCEWEYSLI